MEGMQARLGALLLLGGMQAFMEGLLGEAALSLALARLATK